MLGYICTVVLLYIAISAVWPDRRKKQAEDSRKHTEVLATLARLERQNTPPPVPAALPTYNSAERARVLALGRIRDGDKRHPLLATFARESYFPNRRTPRPSRRTATKAIMVVMAFHSTWVWKPVDAPAPALLLADYQLGLVAGLIGVSASSISFGAISRSSLGSAVRS